MGVEKKLKISVSLLSFQLICDCKGEIYFIKPLIFFSNQKHKGLSIERKKKKN